MRRIAWLTDIHLNFLSDQGLSCFLAELKAARLDALLITGDLAESHDLVGYLERMDDALGIDIDFVLGNHDFYYGQIDEVRARVALLAAERPRLHYLTTATEPLALAEGVGVVGHDGWADARLGDYERSVVSMYDYHLIHDLAGLGKAARWPVLKRLGDAAAAHIRQVLPQALARFAKVFLLTHVPPWREACWHEGRTSDDQWAPHFTCQAMGQAIIDIMRAHPDQQLTVLCGHTHGAGEAWPRDNVLVLTGGAQYGEPQIQRVFEFPTAESP